VVGVVGCIVAVGVEEGEVLEDCGGCDVIEGCGVEGCGVEGCGVDACCFGVWASTVAVEAAESGSEEAEMARVMSVLRVSCWVMVPSKSRRIRLPILTGLFCLFPFWSLLRGSCTWATCEGAGVCTLVEECWLEKGDHGNWNCSQLYTDVSWSCYLRLRRTPQLLSRHTNYRCFLQIINNKHSGYGRNGLLSGTHPQAEARHKPCLPHPSHTQSHAHTHFSRWPCFSSRVSSVGLL
jgi:hypothetical protein